MNCLNKKKLLKKINTLKQGSIYKDICKNINKFESFSTEEKNLTLGDLDILDEKKFFCYIPSIIEYVLNQKELPPLFYIAILSMEIKSLKATGKFMLVANEMSEIMYLFFKCLYDYMINEDKADAIVLKEDYKEEILFSLREWEKLSKQK
jgi:hypothetical protein